MALPMFQAPMSSREKCGCPVADLVRFSVCCTNRCQRAMHILQAALERIETEVLAVGGDPALGPPLKKYTALERREGGQGMMGGPLAMVGGARTVPDSGDGRGRAGDRGRGRVRGRAHEATSSSKGPGVCTDKRKAQKVDQRRSQQRNARLRDDVPIQSVEEKKAVANANRCVYRRAVRDEIPGRSAEKKQAMANADRRVRRQAVSQSAVRDATQSESEAILYALHAASASVITMESTRLMHIHQDIDKAKEQFQSDQCSDTVGVSGGHISALEAEYESTAIAVR